MIEEQHIRLICFAGVLSLMTTWEWLAPRRQQEIKRLRRWPNNLLLVVINSAVVRVAFPITAVAAATVANENGYGLLNWVDWPTAVKVIIGFVLFDLVIYTQHVVFHAVPLLWRLHSVHHADLEYDTTTGIRFHTIEIVLSFALKLGFVFLVGPPALAVLIFEIVLNGTSLFNHGNVSLPPAIDRAIRLVLVTPDMHRVHHSVIRQEADSNYGFNLPWWDYLFGTYRAQPEAGHDKMTIGLAAERDESRVVGIWALLCLPFRHRKQTDDKEK